MTLAGGLSPGALGLLTTLLFIVAAAVIFVAMTGSLRRLRARVARGEFGSDSRSESAGDQTDERDEKLPPT